MTQRFAACCALLAAVLLPVAAQAQFAEQAELPGAPNAETGYSVAISADGSTAILGAPSDNNWVGSATVFVRDPSNGGAWTQQAKLAAPDAIWGANQGNGVALSADGNTAIVGGPLDNHFIGAAWVWTRSGQTWTEQAKLIGTGGIPLEEQGASVSLSSDGNTLLVGAPLDDDNIGAAWVWVRSGTQWTQQAKLVGSGVIAPWSSQGLAVSLSGDGNTALLGGSYDAQNDQGIPRGAAWIFRRGSGGRWRQIVKLTAGDPNLIYFGASVALSGRGTVAIIGALGTDVISGAIDGQPGGAWVFTRSPDGVWEQTTKLAGVDQNNYPYPAEGYSVGISYSGRVAMVAGWFGADNNNIAPGAGYLFVRSPAGASRQWGHALASPNGVNLMGWSGALSADGKTMLLGGPDPAVAALVFGQAAPALADAR